MPDIIRMTLPPSREALAALRSGDEVLLSGPVFTARDATHARLLEVLDATDTLPYGLAGQVLFYAGPTPPAAGRPAGAVGPTTAKRMDAATPRLLAAGIAATIGKGARSEAVRQACIKNGCVYFAAVGGAAALLARHVVDAEPVAWPELGTEALVRLTVEDFPVFVAIDTRGGDLYAEAPAAFRAAAGEGAAAGGAPAVTTDPETAR
jgi:fumarate hydratase class I/fumarate hydratase subunit beta